MTFIRHTLSVVCVAFPLAVRSVSAGELHSFKVDVHGVWDVAVSGDLIAAATTKGRVTLLSIDEREEIGTVELSEHPIQTIAFTPCGEELIAGDEEGGLYVLEVPELEVKMVLTGHEAFVSAIAVSPDGRLLVTGDEEGEVRFWSIPDYELQDGSATTGISNFIICAEFASNGEFLVAASRPGPVFARKEALREFEAFRSDDPRPADVRSDALCIAVSPDDLYVAAAGQFSLQLFSTTIGRRLQSTRTFGPRDEWTNEDGWDIAFSPDGRQIAVAIHKTEQTILRPYHSGEIHLWDVDTFEKTHVLTGHRRWATAVKYLDDGTLVSASLDGTVRLWSLDDLEDDTE